MPDYLTAEAEPIFDTILKDYAVFAPTIKKDKGTFSDTTLVAYDYVTSLTDIAFTEKTYFSAKSLLFPTREKMFTYEKGKLTETSSSPKPTIVFLRSCDIHALDILDQMFLNNGHFEDPYYKIRRENTKVFLLECPEAFNNCYCVSLNTNKTTNYSVFIKKEEHGYSTKINDTEFKKYFSKNIKTTVEPRFSEKDSMTVNIPDNIDVSLFNNPLWDEYTARCIACGRCNTSCPTCSCFTVQSVTDSEDPGKVHRKRIWSSCQVKDFSCLAGNHNFRIPNGDRMRYKVLHKISDFKKRNNTHMCVGCGRCDDVCPEYISMAKSINKIAEITLEARETT